MVDFGLKLLSGNSARKDYGDRRAAVLPTLLEHFDLDRRVSFPPLVSGVVCLYTAVRLKAKG